MPKKTQSYILLFLVFLQTGGFYFFLRSFQEIKRYEMMEKIEKGLSKSSLKCIRIETHDLKKIVWESENKEFWFENQLYDVIETEIETDCIKYFCISDESEELIIKKIDELEEKESSKSPSNQSKMIILKSFFIAYILPSNLISNYLQTMNVFGKKSFLYCNNYSFRHLHSFYQPPKV